MSNILQYNTLHHHNTRFHQYQPLYVLNTMNRVRLKKYGIREMTKFGTFQRIWTHPPLAKPSLKVGCNA
jgi:hypothetical protein